MQEMLFDTEKPATSKMRFQLGRVVATPRALDELSRANLDPMEYITRHVTGRWEGMKAPDILANELAIDCGELRVFSWFRLPSQAMLYVITEGDRSVTTLLLSSEY